MKKIYIVSIIVFAMVTIAAVVYGLRGTMQQVTHIYLLPQGYSGWVEIVYEQPGSPELAREGDDYVHPIPESGVLRTSTPVTSGPMVLYYVDERGNRTEIDPLMVRGQGVTSGPFRQADGTVREMTVNRFFIGTEEAWEEETRKSQPPASTE